MERSANLSYQKICAYSGFVFLALFSVFWGGLAHGFPPISPNASALEVAQHYAQHREGILVGMTLAAVSAGAYVTFTAQLTVAMRKSEDAAPILSLVQLIGGALTAWIVISCPTIWATAAYRADLDPDTVRMLNDLGFIIFNCTYAPTLLQQVTSGLVGLADQSEATVFPRWICYWAILAGIANIPITFVSLVKTGPLAWDGAVSLFVPAVTFYPWVFAMSFYMIKDINRQLRGGTSTALK
jgi:hypothetical protein